MGSGFRYCSSCGDDLVKACAWRGLGVVVVFVVGLGFVFYLSVDLVRFVVDVHALYSCRDAVDSLYDVVRAANLFPSIFLARLT